jgi:hypothetical protein
VQTLPVFNVAVRPPAIDHPDARRLGLDHQPLRRSLSRSVNRSVNRHIRVGRLDKIRAIRDDLWLGQKKPRRDASRRADQHSDYCPVVAPIATDSYDISPETPKK